MKDSLSTHETCLADHVNSHDITVLLERYYRKHVRHYEAGDGTGVALAMVKQAMELMADVHRIMCPRLQHTDYAIDKEG